MATQFEKVDIRKTLLTNEGGLGFTLEMREGVCFVLSLENNPDGSIGNAEIAGIEVNDEIVEVNSLPLQGLPFANVIKERFQIAMFPMTLSLRRYVNSQDQHQYGGGNTMNQQQHANDLYRQQMNHSSQMQKSNIDYNQKATFLSKTNKFYNCRKRFQDNTTQNPFATLSVEEKWQKVLQTYSGTAGLPRKFLKTMNLVKVQDDDLIDIGKRYISNFIKKQDENELNNKKQKVENENEEDNKIESNKIKNGENGIDEILSDEDVDIGQTVQAIKTHLVHFKAEFSSVSTEKDKLKKKYHICCRNNDDLVKICDEEGIVLRGNIDTVLQRYQSTDVSFQALKLKYTNYVNITPPHLTNQTTIANFNAQCDKMKGMLSVLESDRDQANALLNEHDRQRQELMRRHEERMAIMNEICQHYDMKMQSLHSYMVNLMQLIKHLSPESNPI